MKFTTKNTIILSSVAIFTAAVSFAALVSVSALTNTAALAFLIFLGTAMSALAMRVVHLIKHVAVNYGVDAPYAGGNLVRRGSVALAISSVGMLLAMLSNDPGTFNGYALYVSVVLSASIAYAAAGKANKAAVVKIDRNRDE